MFSIGGSFQRESERGRSDSTGRLRRTDSYQAGTFDTFDPLRRLSNQLGEFDLNEVIAISNARAEADTAGAISNIFRQYQESALPEIFVGEIRGGAYSGTSAQLLANDAFSRAVNQSAELQLGVASSYIAQNLQARDQLMNQFAQLLQANLQQSGSSSTDALETQSVRTQGRRTGIGINFGYGGGGGSPTLTGGGGR